ncbi:hypothetical protein P7K49_027360, partial [Saguinus oedipus]
GVNISMPDTEVTILGGLGERGQVLEREDTPLEKPLECTVALPVMQLLPLCVGMGVNCKRMQAAYLGLQSMKV